MNETNQNINENNNPEVASAISFDSPMAPAEITVVSKVADVFLRRRFGATCEADIDKLDSLVQSVFDKEMLALNASADLRLRLNYITHLSIEIGTNYLNAQAFIDNLHKHYELESLFQIYKNAIDEALLIMEIKPLVPHELPFRPQRYLDINHLLCVYEYVELMSLSTSWHEIAGFFELCRLTTPMGIDYESPSIDINLQIQLSKTRAEIEEILGKESSLNIAFKCILSDSVADKATLLQVFSIPTYFAAKAFAYIFPLMSKEEQNAFLDLDRWDQEKALINIILDDSKSYTEAIRNEYISSLLQSYPIG